MKLRFFITLLIFFALFFLTATITPTASPVFAQPCHSDPGCPEEFMGPNTCIREEVRNFWYCYYNALLLCIPTQWEDMSYHPCGWIPGCCPDPTATPTEEPTATPTLEPTATPTPTPTPTPINCGEWGSCGSCDTCGHPQSECVFHRKDADDGCGEECLWDPGHCSGPTDTPTPTPSGPTATPTPTGRPTSTPTPTSPPNRISGNVYIDSGDSCSTSTKVGAAPWDTARMKLTDLGLEDMLDDGSFQFNSVVGGGHGLWIYKNAGSLGLPSGWLCSGCVAGNTCPGTAGASPGTYNFFVKQGVNAWSQTQGGDIHAGKNPGQGLSDPLLPGTYLSVNQDGYPGVVSAGGTINVSPGQVSSKNWQVENQPYGLGQTYDYDYFYKKAGSPTATNFTGSKPGVLISYRNAADGDVTTSGNWQINSGEKYIILVEKNLRIGGKIIVANGGFLAFIVRGNITIDPNLGNNPASANRDDPVIEGIYVSNGSLDTSVGVSTHERFVGRGIFVAWGGFNLQRDLAGNNLNYAAELFTYRPEFLMNAPKELQKRSMSWTEVAP